MNEFLWNSNGIMVEESLENFIFFYLFTNIQRNEQGWGIRRINQDKEFIECKVCAKKIKEYLPQVTWERRVNLSS